jgi:EmrB/QacA subfamily drug resistance transporter
MGTTQGRWVIAATVLGSGVAFLDGSVVNTALPSIQRTFDASLAGQQWVVTSYLLALGSLLVLGGALGDLYGRRRVFVIGLVGFSITSIACGLAPNLEILIGARVLKGVSAALVVPGSLAMLSAVFDPEDRAQAIGSWSGLASVSTALGPFLGGWLIDTASWRWVFLINPVLAGAAIVISIRFVPETQSSGLQPSGLLPSRSPRTRLDIPGALTLSIGLGGVVYSLIEGPTNDWPMLPIISAVIGIALLGAFLFVETKTEHPMVPLSLFRSRVFAGTTAATFMIWGALAAVFFLVTIHLQNNLGYSALEAGAATIPVTIVLLFSSRSGELAQRIGARLPMIIGSAVIALGFAVLSIINPGVTYLSSVFPGVIVFALGLVITVAPLTATALGSVDPERAGIGSAINNAVSRIAGLLAIAVLPTLAGITGTQGASLEAGFGTAMWICAGLSMTGSLICALTIPNKLHPNKLHPERPIPNKRPM